jgi:2-methylisocitrate lyase-like PEP mutase family enzyme
LHESGCFILPNPWDIGSAIYLWHLGFRALATTSAGFAFARGLPDTPLAVNADFQSGYAADPDGVAANVALCIKTGVAGLSIEDATDDRSAPLYERARAVDRIRAARKAIDATGIPVILTARCEAWTVGASDPAGTALDRLVAFAEAGADCLYAPGVRDLETISTIVKAVAPKPVNVLVSSPGAGLSLSRLADVGVRRISFGSALARTAWTAFIRAARNIFETGSFEAIGGSIPFSELNGFFGSYAGKKPLPR